MFHDWFHKLELEVISFITLIPFSRYLLYIDDEVSLQPPIKWEEYDLVTRFEVGHCQDLQFSQCQQLLVLATIFSQRTRSD